LDSQPSLFPYTTLFRSLAENLGLDTARIKHTTLNGEKLEIAIAGGRHELALKKILELLEQYHFIAVGHRVVHGGREYSEAVRVRSEEHTSELQSRFDLV